MSRSKFLSLITVGALAVGAFQYLGASPAVASACTASGTPLASGGTSGSPTLISTAAELVQLSVDSNAASLTGYYKLAADIDLAGCEWTPIGAWSLSLPARTWFQGTLDGDGHVISNLSITSGTDRIGLVGYTYQGTIKNLGVENASITTSATAVGAIVGLGRGTLENVFSTGSVTGHSYVGGIAGDLQTFGSISNSYSTADVTATSQDAGGLVGVQQGSGPSVDPRISNSFSAGAVSAPVNSGGLVGTQLTGTITNSFYDRDRSFQTDTGSGEPKSTSELKSFSTFSTASWGITDGWETFDPSSSKIWGICSPVNGGYPFLLWQLSSASSCTASPVSAAASAEVGSSSTGIFLYLPGRPGSPAEGCPVYFGSVSVKPNTTYILSIQSVTNPALTRTVLATGTTNNWGHADKRLEMGKLAAGTYKVVMTGTHRLDYPLVLTNYISIDRNGNFISLSPESLQPTLS